MSSQVPYWNDDSFQPASYGASVGPSYDSAMPERRKVWRGPQASAAPARDRGPAGTPMVDNISGALTIPAFGQQYSRTVSEGTHNNLALWYIDVRNFRAINPKYGFSAGNYVLKIVHEGIRRFLSNNLPVTRLGGDRFVLLTENLDLPHAEDAYEQLFPYVSDRIATRGIKQPLMLAAGIYYLRESDYVNPNFQRPLDYASIAHRKAKLGNDSSLVPFSDEDLERDNRRITIEASIDEALATGQIEVWYQPQVDYTYDEIIGAEALARWKHPELGWISPTEFVPILENCGKIHSLDLYVWEEACRNAGRWRIAADGRPVPISVNVSRLEFLDDNLLKHFLDLRNKYDLPSGSLRLEVTESAFVDGGGRIQDIVEKMRENDMVVEMDDFGSGLSSLSMLRDLPVDVVKLDMGFMQSAVSGDRGGVVLGSVIRMLQGLDTPIIAEGVETLEQAEMLKNMGCHLMQGYHFSQPMPLGEFESFLESNQTVEFSKRRERHSTHLDDLLSMDASSSYLFNHAMGGTIFFFAGDGVSESILVNDLFYEECGLDREVFGSTKINPIDEVDPQSRSNLWRAAAEAREKGVAMCRAQVRLSGRWFDGVIRYFGPSSRGDVYSLNILRSWKKENANDRAVQLMRDLSWNMDMLSEIVPTGYVKCRLDPDLSMDSPSPAFIASSGLSDEEFVRRYHNSFMECVYAEDRPELEEAIEENRYTNSTFSLDLRLLHGYGMQIVSAHVVGKTQLDSKKNAWVYLLVMLQGTPQSNEDMTCDDKRALTFEYHMDEDLLVVHTTQSDGARRDVTLEHCMQALECRPDLMSHESAIKASSLARDLRHHSVTGFIDLKCNLRGGDQLRWYHVNYTCEQNEEGVTSVLHGYAQDANDSRGSTRWWRQQAECDQLTGLLNRNAVSQQINHSMRTSGAGMMLMIDLDGFKRVNDELGHLTGDMLLRDVADVLSALFCNDDLVGRYGGDEFIAFVSLSETDGAEQASARAQEVIDAVGSIEISDGSHVACSVGVAISHERNDTFYDLLEVADKAMYESKSSGKGTYTIVSL